MTNLPDSPETPIIEDNKEENAAAHERLEHSAERAAEKAGRTEQSYDKSHDIFTK